MRKLTLLLLAVFASLPVVAEERGKVFMFVRDGSRDLDLMLTEEVGVMRDMLVAAGYSVDIATADDAPMATDSASLLPTVALADVDVADYVGVVLPCMAPARGFGVPESVEAIVAEANEAGLPIAASRGSVGVLASAGALRGHRYAYASPVDLDERPEFTGGQFIGIGVTRDANISTAGICPLASRSLGEPDGTVDLMHQFLSSLDENT